MARTQRGTNVEEDAWLKLKLFCTRNSLQLGDKAGDIIHEWVSENCEPTVA